MGNEGSSNSTACWDPTSSPTGSAGRSVVLITSISPFPRRSLDHALGAEPLLCAPRFLSLAVAGEIPQFPYLSLGGTKLGRTTPCSTNWQIHSASFTSVFLPGTFP